MCSGGGRRTVERIVDLAVYAPLGLVSVAAEQLPAAFEHRRRRVEQQLVLARFVGRLVAQQGGRQVRQRLDTAGHPIERPADGSTVVTAPPTERSSSLDDRSGDVSADALPIDDYESLAASQVVARLASLSSAERDKVAAFEAAHRNRRTILGKVDQLRTDRR